jgi:xylulokinase
MTEPRHYILAIDLGTSGPKVALATAQGDILAWAFEDVPLLLLPGGGAEQRPADWWAAICRTARRVLDQGLAPVDEIAAVTASVHWSGTVAVGADGEALANAIIWMDTRGAPAIDRITDGPIKVEGYDLGKMLRWIRLTGGGPAHSGKDSLAHILYLKEAQPEIYRQTHKFLEPRDYINYRLCGRMTATADSIALHWVTDNRRLDRVAYVDELLAIAGLERAQLPDLLPANSILGPITPAAARDLGLGPKTQVISGAPDVQAAAVGSGAVRDFETHLYIGTSSWITCHVPMKKTDVLHNMASLPSAIPGRYFIANDQETAGACLTWLRDNLFFANDELAAGPRPDGVYKRFDGLAAGAAPGSGGLIFTPWLYGERTPVEDGALRGGFFNLSLRATRDQVVRAVFEGVAYNSRWLFGYVEKFVNRKIEALNMIGGGASSDIWCQIHADVLNRPIRQMRDPIQANARGVIFLAAAALGYMTYEQIAQRAEVAHTYQPDPANRRLYDGLFAEFLNIYKNNKAAFARLNKP